MKLVKKTSQDASDGWVESLSVQSAACCMVRTSEETLGTSTHSVKYLLRDCVSSKKIEHNYVDCFEFAMVFIRANYAGASVLHMPLSNHVSRLILPYDLWTSVQKVLV